MVQGVDKMEERNPLPESPTAIAQATGLGAPGLDDVRGTLEEALVVPPAPRRDDDLKIVPGQSGAEALADLPNAGPEDPWDGP